MYACVYVSDGGLPLIDGRLIVLFAMSAVEPELVIVTTQLFRLNVLGVPAWIGWAVHNPNSCIVISNLSGVSVQNVIALPICAAVFVYLPSTFELIAAVHFGGAEAFATSVKAVKPNNPIQLQLSWCFLEDFVWISSE